MIANLVPALTTGMAVSALPAVAESFARGNRLRTQKSIQMVLRITALFCVPAGLGISALSQEVCSLFFGMNNEVMIGAPLLRVLGLASIFIALTGHHQQPAAGGGQSQPAGQAHPYRQCHQAGDELPAGGHPQLNIQAAPWSTLVCYVVITLLSLIALRSTVGPLGAFGVFGKPLLAGLLCAAFARLTQNMLMQVTASRFAVLLSAAVGAAVYLVGLLLLRALKKEDIMMLPKGEKMAKILEKYSLLG